MRSIWLWPAWHGRRRWLAVTQKVGRRLGDEDLAVILDHLAVSGPAGELVTADEAQADAMTVRVRVREVFHAPPPARVAGRR
jgi:hypothetical protein